MTKVESTLMNALPELFWVAEDPDLEAYNDSMLLPGTYLENDMAST